PRAEVADAVTASCSVPWLFAPVRIAGRDYVDGAVWSPTDLDAAPAGRGTRVLCLTPTGGAAFPRSFLAALRTAGRTAAEAEAAV
ncbi:patatin-like phospholipase family protein, partial [Escherichia coli]|nr:patatin-like phospholipase family protein [Escherichia coli]